jgi:vacuolar-type H+-ATPase subunit I/STV1
MVSESEILTSFLLERSDFTKELKDLKSFFPKDTPEPLIRKVQSILVRRYQRRLDSVNTMIQTLGEQEKRNAKLNEGDLERDISKRGDIGAIVKKLDDLGTVLDSEIEQLETKVREEQESFKATIDDLKDIIIPPDDDDDEHIQVILQLLDIFDTLQSG